jgi:hypothetical protein
MALLPLNLYFNVATKTLVSYQGSPTSIPPFYYLDNPTINVYPVIPNPQNPSAYVQAISLAGWSMDLVCCASAPNAAAPPASFTSLAMNPDPTNTFFTGVLNMSAAGVLAALGTSASLQFYICFDMFQAGGTNRTTLFQSSQPDQIVYPSLDVPGNPTPAGPGVVYLTLQNALNTFVQIGPVPNKQIQFQSGALIRQLTIGPDGSEQWNVIA